MPESPDWLVVYQSALAGLSLALLGVAASRHLRRGFVVPYAPRRPVPWGAFAAFPAGLFVFLNVATALTPPGAIDATPTVEIEPLAFFYAAVNEALVSVALIGAVVAMVVSEGRATWADFGLSGGLKQLGPDALLGAGAAIACMVPVLGLHALIQFTTGAGYDHPTLEAIFKTPNLATLVATFLVAVVQAPLREEFFFRVLFQGWLEKAEPELLRSLGPGAREADPDPFGTPDPEAATKTAPDAEEPFGPAGPVRPSFGGLSVGWAPVLVSGLAFALSHLQQGTALAPLFLFGVVLGWLYHRTHRVAPCLVAHAVFNAASLVEAWGEAWALTS